MCISLKAPIASREYTNDGSQTRPLCEKILYYKIRKEKDGLEFALVLDDSNLHGFLGRFSRRNSVTIA